MRFIWGVVEMIKNVVIFVFFEKNLGQVFMFLSCDKL